MTLHWRHSPDADRATLVVAGVIVLHLVVRDREYAVEGPDGRRITGPCTSRGHGREAALRAAAEALERGASEARHVLLAMG